MQNSSKGEKNIHFSITKELVRKTRLFFNGFHSSTFVQVIGDKDAIKIESFLRIKQNKLCKRTLSYASETVFRLSFQSSCI